MYQAQVIRFPEVKMRTGLSRTTIFRLERANLFPKRRLIGPRSIGWVLQEVIDWMHSTPKVIIGTPEAK